MSDFHTAALVSSLSGMEPMLCRSAALARKLSEVEVLPYLRRGNPQPVQRVRCFAVAVIAGSQVTFHAEASSLAAAQISYPTPSNACDTPLPKPTPLALTRPPRSAGTPRPG